MKQSQNACKQKTAHAAASNPISVARKKRKEGRKKGREKRQKERELEKKGKATTKQSIPRFRQAGRQAHCNGVME